MDHGIKTSTDSNQHLLMSSSQKSLSSSSSAAHHPSTSTLSTVVSKENSIFFGTSDNNKRSMSSSASGTSFSKRDDDRRVESGCHGSDQTSSTSPSCDMRTSTSVSRDMIRYAQNYYDHQKRMIGIFVSILLMMGLLTGVAITNHSKQNLQSSSSSGMNQLFGISSAFSSWKSKLGLMTPDEDVNTSDDVVVVETSCGKITGSLEESSFVFKVCLMHSSSLF